MNKQCLNGDMFGMCMRVEVREIRKIKHKLLDVFGDIGYFTASKTFFMAVLMCV